MASPGVTPVKGIPLPPATQPPMPHVQQTLDELNVLREELSNMMQAEMPNMRKPRPVFSMGPEKKTPEQMQKDERRAQLRQREEELMTELRSMSPWPTTSY